jgi:hypothetical protein
MRTAISSDTIGAAAVREMAGKTSARSERTCGLADETCTAEAGAPPDDEASNGGADEEDEEEAEGSMVTSFENVVAAVRKPILERLLRGT